MDDLVQWLTAQLDADERIALAAARLSGSLSGGSPDVGERWRVSGSHADDGGTYWSVTTASPDLDRIPVVEMVGSGMSGGGAHTEEVADHIAAHDPARVLREVGATRQIVELHVITVEKVDLPPFDSYTGERNPDEYNVTCAICGWASDDPTSACLTLRLSALPYADRPGYREEWAPAE